MQLANIVNGRPTAADPVRPTLIVATPALVSQWYKEIGFHVEKKAAGKVIKYMSTRGKSENDVQAMSKNDIVLTTYTEVMKSLPKFDAPVELQTAREKSEWWDKHLEENKGLLHRVQWRRIVLDEAQAIKNHTSRTSAACRLLQGKYRWALSGTPIMNGLSELYPYFKFLRVPYTGSFKVFKTNYYGKNDARKLERLQQLLSTFMIRRTHADKLFGAPLLKLPKNYEKIHWCFFNELERNVYEIVRRRMANRLQDYINTRSLERNYSNILTMILRLRQLCGHILMVDVALQDLLEWEDHEKLREIAEAEKHPNMNDDRGKQLIALRKALAASAAQARSRPREDEDGTRSEMPEDQDGSRRQDKDNEMVIIDEDIGETFRENHFFKYLESLREGKNWETLTNSTHCHSCNKPPMDPHLTSCYHVYCKDCIEGLSLSAARRDSDRARCLECGVIFDQSWPISQGRLTDAHNANPKRRADPNDAVSKLSKKLSQDARDEMNVKKWIAAADVLPSAKTMAVKAQLMNWFQENGSLKVIIYTQFISMIMILEKMCEIEGWGCEKVCHLWKRERGGRGD